MYIITSRDRKINYLSTFIIICDRRYYIHDCIDFTARVIKFVSNRRVKCSKTKSAVSEMKYSQEKPDYISLTDRFRHKGRRGEDDGQKDCKGDERFHLVVNLYRTL